ncbi:MAG: FtsX-like permease family protein [Coriobacteriales bacterium]|jgi:putative ABC transport system permease protein|nr:FtsX-like permease family protein [Coriobacteriales bacterium]
MVRRNPLTTFRISRINLQRRKFRSISLIVLIGFVTFVIGGGTLLGYALENGVRSTADRLGGDAIFLPLGADKQFEGALLEGKPSTFYLSGDLVEQLSRARGVKQASAQLYIATFDSSHCAALVQIIAYEPTTDFVVSPWLAERVPQGPQYGEVIVGNRVTLQVGEEMRIFGSDYEVAGRLEKTGMGFDTSVFVSMETAELLLADYAQYLEAIPLPDDNARSVVIVNIEDGQDHEEFAKGIRTEYRGVSVVLPQSIISTISQNLNLTLGVIVVLLLALWFLVIASLTISFTALLNERECEFGILRALGATRGKLTSIILTESTLLSLVGTAAGTVFLCLVFFPFNLLIENQIGARYLLPEAPFTVAILLLCFVVCAAIGPLSSLLCAIRIGKKETLQIMREDS